MFLKIIFSLMAVIVMVNAQKQKPESFSQLACEACTTHSGFWLDMRRSILDVPSSLKYRNGYFCIYDYGKNVHWILLRGFDKAETCRNGSETFYVSQGGDVLKVLDEVILQLETISTNLDPCRKALRLRTPLPMLNPFVKVEPENLDKTPSGRTKWNALEKVLNYFNLLSRNNSIQQTMEMAAAFNPLTRPMMILAEEEAALFSTDGPKSTTTKVPITRPTVKRNTTRFIVPHLNSDEEN